MPGPIFFRHLGLFVQPGFFESALCLQIREQICAADSEKAVIAGAGPEGNFIDEDTRKVLSAKLDNSTAGLIRQRLLDLKPHVEEHFHISLTSCTDPEFLRYLPGAFYKPHRDASSGAIPTIRRRRVSVVMFLNAQAGNLLPIATEEVL